MIKTVLLCPPDHYQIEYVINPWMNTENKVDKNQAFEEYEKLKEIYKKLGLEVLEITSRPGLPDMVYAANHGFVIDDVFIKSNFRFPQRKKEADHAEEFFKKNHFTVKNLPDDVSFEGQGDLFFREGKFFCGYGRRTDKKAIDYLEEILGEKLLSFEVNDPYFYHLDTCFAPIGRGIVVVNPASFKKEDLEKIKKNFRKVITTDKLDNQVMCCNLISANGAVVLGTGVDGIKKDLEKEGFEVITTPMAEFLKGGGSVKCLTLEFFRS